MGPLYVVTAISNPRRYASRARLYREFASHISNAGAIHYTVEVAFGDRPFEIQSDGTDRFLRLRTSDEIWHKENALNLAINRLPAEAEYIAWVDADVHWARNDWAEETVHMLQHHQVVQMFSQSQDLYHDYTVVPDVSGGEQLPSMVRQALLGSAWPSSGNPYAKHPGHSGYAWAARREALDTLGGLIDFSILGANDHHMARGMLDNIDTSVNVRCSPGLKSMLHTWGERAKKLRRDIGFVNGLLLHNWHGPKRNRGYLTRWQILVKGQFDPHTDIQRDSQGLYNLTDDGSDRMRILRDDIRDYFQSRDEDSRSL